MFMGDAMFSIIPVFMMIVFAIVITSIIVSMVRGVRTWGYNNSQPVLDVNAKIVSKRTDVSGGMHHNANGTGHHSHARTRYYVTFEVQSGDRMELNMDGHQFGMLAEGDRGVLTFQGTRYIGFKRDKDY